MATVTDGINKPWYAQGGSRWPPFLHPSGVQLTVRWTDLWVLSTWRSIDIILCVCLFIRSPCMLPRSHEMASVAAEDSTVVTTQLREWIVSVTSNGGRGRSTVHWKRPRGWIWGCFMIRYRRGWFTHTHSGQLLLPPGWLGFVHGVWKNRYSCLDNDPIASPNLGKLS